MLTDVLSGEQKEDGCYEGNVCGTYVHGIFDQGTIASEIIKGLADRKGVKLEGDRRMTKEQLYGRSIPLPDKTIEGKIQERWDHLAKPLDGLGRFEKIIAKLGAITGTERVTLSSKAVLVFCADNGIVEEGISQTGQEVTAIMAENMTRGESAVCQMAASIGASVKVVDIGVNRAMEIEGIGRNYRRYSRIFHNPM